MQERTPGVLSIRVFHGILIKQPVWLRITSSVCVLVHNLDHLRYRLELLDDRNLDERNLLILLRIHCLRDQER